ncbi:MAG: DNA mismatch repair protein MutS [Breznakiellaceae bacterium]
MKVFLMYPDRDFNMSEPLPSHHEALAQDMDMAILIEAMGGGDRFITEVAKAALFQSLYVPDHILYRQEILQDAFQNEELIESLYAVTSEALEVKRRSWFTILGASPSSILYSSVLLLQAYLPLLEELQRIAFQGLGRCVSRGFRRFFAMIQQELSDEYLQFLGRYLKTLRFEQGIMIRAQLGTGNKPVDYQLQKPLAPDPHWLRRLFGRRSPSYSFSIDPRDEAGGRALDEIRNRGLNTGANAVAQAADHVESFFKVLRTELAFYKACLNLKQRLSAMGEPLCFPEVVTTETALLEGKDLYNPCLSLTSGKATVKNDIQARGKNLIIITGVNEGGKSTFLRSLGVAQLMMQAGLFVPAQRFRADIRSGIFTHYRRKEDRTMSSGKFDEELKRMSQIIDQIRGTPGAPLILFNESFASTNEREGSEIARQIVQALLEIGAKIVFVTHLYTFAHYFYERAATTTLMLRADRTKEGGRSFKILEGAPSQRSHGEDLYRKIFETPLGDIQNPYGKEEEYFIDKEENAPGEASHEGL